MVLSNLEILLLTCRCRLHERTRQHEFNFLWSDEHLLPCSQSFQRVWSIHCTHDALMRDLDTVLRKPHAISPAEWRYTVEQLPIVPTQLVPRHVRNHASVDELHWTTACWLPVRRHQAFGGAATSGHPTAATRTTHRRTRTDQRTARVRTLHGNERTDHKTHSASIIQRNHLRAIILNLPVFFFFWHAYKSSGSQQPMRLSSIEQTQVSGDIGTLLYVLQLTRRGMAEKYWIWI